MSARIREVRELAASPQAVWRSLTDAHRLSDWFWPASLATVARMDARAGGHFEIASIPAGIRVSGPVLAADEPEQLQLGWQWDGEDAVSAVVVTLTAQGSGTVLTLEHSGLADDQDAANHSQGWNDCLDRLDEVLKA